MGNRLLTLDDLCNFFSEKNIQHFSEKESGYRLCVQVPSELTIEDTVKKQTFENDPNPNDKDLLFTKVRIMSDGINRNNSNCTKESLEMAGKHLAYRPILAAFDSEIDENGNEVYDFTTHEMVLDENDQIEYIEKQVGCFTTDEAYLVYDEEMDKNFLYGIAAIPREYTKAAEIIERKNGTKVSVELSCSEVSFDAKTKSLNLDSYFVTGLTLLGEKVKEGMASARLDILDMAEFSEKNNSIVTNSITNANFEDISNQLIEMQDKLTELTACFNNKILGKEELTVSKVKMNNETTEEVNAPVEDTDTNVPVVEDVKPTDGQSNEDDVDNADADISVEMDEDGDDSSADGGTTPDSSDDSVAGDDTNSGEASEPDGTPDDSNDDTEDTEGEANTGADSDDTTGATEDNSDVVVTDDEVSKKKKIVEGTYSITIGDVTKTFSMSMNDKIYALSDLVNISYGELDNAYYAVQAYDDCVVMSDYWTGRSYKQSYVCNDGVFSLVGERVEVFVEYLTAEEQTTLDSMRNNYQSLMEYKENHEKAEAIAEKMAIANDEKYSSITNDDSYKELVSNVENYSADEFEKELKTIFAEHVLNNGEYTAKKPITFNKTVNPNRTVNTGKYKGFRVR